jgi:hypothetical protein
LFEPQRPHHHEATTGAEIHAPQCPNEVNIEEDGVAVEVRVPSFLLSTCEAACCSWDYILSAEQETDFEKVNTGEEVEVAHEAAMIPDEEVMAVIASGQRRKTSSIWESTWTRRSA